MVEAIRTVTVGIPARNEELVIERKISSLLSQKLPEGTRQEILVCVNASGDRTAEIVKGIASRDNRVKLLETETPGKPNAINLIREHAAGSEIVFCDADTIMEDEAIAKILHILDNQKGLHAVSVRVLPQERKGRNWVEAMAAAVRKFSNPSMTGLSGAFFAVRRESLPEIPQHVINEDSWLSRTFRQSGKKFALLPGVEVSQQMAANLPDYLRQRIRLRAGREQMKELGLAKVPNRARGNTLQKLKQLKASDRMLLLPALGIAAYARLAGIRAYRKGRFQKGWTPVKRK